MLLSGSAASMTGSEFWKRKWQPIIRKTVPNIVALSVHYRAITNSSVSITGKFGIFLFKYSAPKNTSLKNVLIIIKICKNCTIILEPKNLTKNLALALFWALLRNCTRNFAQTCTETQVNFGPIFLVQPSHPPF